MLAAFCSGQVVVTMRAFYKGNLVNLDSIIVENKSRPGKRTWAAPPSVNTYLIDLMQGTIINGIAVPADEKNQVSPGSNEPGKARILFDLNQQEQVHVQLYTMTGSLWRDWDLTLPANRSMVEITTGGEQLFIGRITGRTIHFSFKMTGTASSSASCNLMAESGMLRASSGFQFQPGDTVQFTACRNGLYRNSKHFRPVNGDSVTIFLSAPCNGTPFVVDYDGNVYHTVEILNRCWTRENIRATHYADGTPLVDGTGAGNIGSNYDTRYFFDYNDNPDLVTVYGRLYNAIAATNGQYNNRTRGICPYGWHLSTCDEWCELERFLDATVTNCNTGMAGEAGNYGYTIRNKMIETGTEHWDFLALGRFNPSTNETGFTALPGGFRNSTEFISIQFRGDWWALPATGGNKYTLPARFFLTNYKGVNRAWVFGSFGLSVRCVKDD
jgi:uncharacterized protein (TIGR02145 family)